MYTHEIVADLLTDPTSKKQKLDLQLLCLPLNFSFSVSDSWLTSVCLASWQSVLVSAGHPSHQGQRHQEWTQFSVCLYEVQPLLKGPRPICDLPLFTVCGLQASDTETALQRLLLSPHNSQSRSLYRQWLDLPWRGAMTFWLKANFPPITSRKAYCWDRGNHVPCFDGHSSYPLFAILELKILSG